MSTLSLHGITSISMERRTLYEGEVVKLVIEGNSLDGPSYFTVNLFGNEGISVKTDEVQPVPSTIVELVEEANAA